MKVSAAVRFLEAVLRKRVDRQLHALTVEGEEEARLQRLLARERAKRRAKKHMGVGGPGPAHEVGPAETLASGVSPPLRAGPGADGATEGR